MLNVEESARVCWHFRNLGDMCGMENKYLICGRWERFGGVGSAQESAGHWSVGGKAFHFHPFLGFLFSSL